MSLNELASAARSSVPRAGMRSSRSPADSRLAACAACRSGTTTQRVTRETMPASRTMSTTPALMIVVWMRLSACCCWMNGKR